LPPFHAAGRNLFVVETRPTITPHPEMSVAKLSVKSGNRGSSLPCSLSQRRARTDSSLSENSAPTTCPFIIERDGGSFTPLAAQLREFAVLPDEGARAIRSIESQHRGEVAYRLL